MNYNNEPLISSRPERPSASWRISPGQSFRRNDGKDAPGKAGIMKTVRAGKMENARNSFLTELHLQNPKEVRIQMFRPQKQLFIEQQYCADDFTFLLITLGDALGYYSISLSGKRKKRLKLT